MKNKMYRNQVNIKWEAFSQNLMGISSDYFKKEFTDCSIIAAGKEFKVHRLVLVGASDYFKDIITLCAGASKYPMIILNMHERFVDYILQYIYRGNVKVPAADYDELMKHAVFLRIKGFSAMRSASLPLASPNKELKMVRKTVASPSRAENAAFRKPQQSSPLGQAKKLCSSVTITPVMKNTAVKQRQVQTQKTPKKNVVPVDHSYATAMHPIEALPNEYIILAEHVKEADTQPMASISSERENKQIAQKKANTFSHLIAALEEGCEEMQYQEPTENIEMELENIDSLGTTENVEIIDTTSFGQDSTPKNADNCFSSNDTEENSASFATFKGKHPINVFNKVSSNHAEYEESFYPKQAAEQNY